MNWNRWIRQTHRWFSVAFTIVVIMNGVAVVRGKYNNTLGLLAVAVLAFLFLTGAYLFALPWAARWRSSQRA
jgi:high-affinity Fe2+/Pb2+ permease